MPFWVTDPVTKLLKGMLNDNELAQKLSVIWAAPDIGINTIGEFVEVQQYIHMSCRFTSATFHPLGFF